VGGVGDELAKTVTTRALGAHRIFDVREHLVERDAEPTELGGRVALRHASGEVACRDPLGGLDHLADGADGPPHRPPGRDGSEEENPTAGAKE
jgi:hypothetical protein